MLDYSSSDEDSIASDEWVRNMRDGKIDWKTKKIYVRKIEILKLWLFDNHRAEIITEDERDSVTSGILIPQLTYVLP